MKGKGGGGSMGREVWQRRVLIARNQLEVRRKHGVDYSFPKSGYLVNDHNSSSLYFRERHAGNLISFHQGPLAPPPKWASVSL